MYTRVERTPVIFRLTSFHHQQLGHIIVCSVQLLCRTTGTVPPDRHVRENKDGESAKKQEKQNKMEQEKERENCINCEVRADRHRLKHEISPAAPGSTIMTERQLEADRTRPSAPPEVCLIIASHLLCEHTWRGRETAQNCSRGSSPPPPLISFSPRRPALPSPRTLQPNHSGRNRATENSARSYPFNIRCSGGTLAPFVGAYV